MNEDKKLMKIRINEDKKNFIQIRILNNKYIYFMLNKKINK